MELHPVSTVLEELHSSMGELRESLDIDSLKEDAKILLKGLVSRFLDIPGGSKGYTEAFSPAKPFRSVAKNGTRTGRVNHFSRVA